MKVHPLIVSAFLAGLLGLQGWMLKEISALKVTVAGLSARIELSAGQSHLAQK